MKWMKYAMVAAAGIMLLMSVSATASDKVERPKLMKSAPAVPSELLVNAYRIYGKT
jgi:hypothetical protein